MIKVWSWREAVQKSKLPPTTKLVLFNLALHMNEVGQSCFPSTKQQAKDTGLTERTICTHIQTAVDRGFLKKSRHGFSGQGWARNEYSAALPEGIELGHAKPSTAHLSDFDNRTKGTERASAPHFDNPPQGTEPDDKKALNDVQSNSPIELSSKKEPPKGGDPYIFEGDVIRMTEKDWNAWRDEFALDDDTLAGFMDSRDKFLASLPTSDRRRKLWYLPTKQELKKHVPPSQIVPPQKPKQERKQHAPR